MTKRKAKKNLANQPILDLALENFKQNQSKLNTTTDSQNDSIKLKKNSKRKKKTLIRDACEGQGVTMYM